jgi:hypothetical protein
MSNLLIRSRAGTATCCQESPRTRVRSRPAARAGRTPRLQTEAGVLFTGIEGGPASPTGRRTSTPGVKTRTGVCVWICFLS